MTNAISSKIAHIGLARQNGLGDVSKLKPDFRAYFSSSPSLLPIKNRTPLAATNRTRDVQPNITASLGFGGDFEVYAHPQIVGPIFYGGLGAVADSGADPNYSHLVTPATAVPYWTIFFMLGDVILYRAYDVVLDTVTLAGQASSPLTLSCSSQGIRAMLAALDVTDSVDPEALVGAPAGYLYMEAEGQLLVGGVATRLISVNLSVTNNASPAIADGYRPYDIDLGERSVSLGYSTRFTNLAQFKDVYFGGGVGGVDQSPAVVEVEHDFTWTRDADTELNANLKRVVTVGFPAEPDPGGAPVTVDTVNEVNPDPTGTDPVLSVTVKDQRASY